MNYLVFLDPSAMELEKILSGVKTMIAKEFNPLAESSVRPGDSLYFLRNRHECELRVKATVVRALPVTNYRVDDLSHALKEMQPRLQFTEAQFNDWSAKKQLVLVQFDSAHKIDVIHVAANKITDRTEWIAFEAFDFIT